jgi:MFS family permease
MNSYLSQRTTRSALIALSVFTLLHIINIGDRTLLLVLGESIKHDLNLSDTQLGNLSGIAFAVVYGIAALPISRFADKGFHRVVIVGSVAVWSVMTMAGAGARTFLQMAFTRVGVAMGEASLDPASHALISILFSERRRPLAMTIYALGLPLGMAVGSIAAGIIAAKFGWRMAFTMTGIAGLVMLPATWFFLPKSDPVRERSHLSFFQTSKLLLSDPAMRNLCLGYGVAALFGFSYAAFVGPYFIRVLGFTPLQLGAALGGVIAIASIVGTFAGGVLQDFFGRRRASNGLIPVVIGLIISAVTALLSFLTDNTAIALTTTAISQCLYLFMFSPSFTVAQIIVPREHRATASALLGLFGGVIGASLGPLITGFLSDALTPHIGNNGLRYALCIITSAELVGAFFYWRASRHMRAREGGSGPTHHFGLVVVPAV